MSSEKIIGNKIAAARKKVNISQAKLGEKLFISPQAVGKWERGESMPDITTIIRLAEILDVDLNYFSEGIRSKNTENFSESTEQADAQKSDNINKNPGWDMSQGNWVDADFSGLKNLQEKFNSSNMQRCKFIGSDLAGLQLKGNNIEGCDFSRSDISGSHFKGSHLVNNKFKECSLFQSEFTENHIKRCDFSQANLTKAKFNFCSFINNEVVNSLWNHCSFINTQITDLVFGGTINSCYFDNCSFKNVAFQNATLINTFFKGKRLKGIRFVDSKADRMTYEFLKNGKADLSGIKLITEEGK